MENDIGFIDWNKNKLSMFKYTFYSHCWKIHLTQHHSQIRHPNQFESMIDRYCMMMLTIRPMPPMMMKPMRYSYFVVHLQCRLLNHLTFCDVHSNETNLFFIRLQSWKKWIRNFFRLFREMNNFIARNELKLLNELKDFGNFFFSE